MLSFIIRIAICNPDIITERAGTYTLSASGQAGQFVVEVVAGTTGAQFASPLMSEVSGTCNQRTQSPTSAITFTSAGTATIRMAWSTVGQGGPVFVTADCTYTVTAAAGGPPAPPPPPPAASPPGSTKATSNVQRVRPHSTGAWVMTAVVCVFAAIYGHQW